MRAGSLLVSALSTAASKTGFSYEPQFVPRRSAGVVHICRRSLMLASVFHAQSAASKSPFCRRVTNVRSSTGSIVTRTPMRANWSCTSTAIWVLDLLEGGTEIAKASGCPFFRRTPSAPRCHPSESNIRAAATVSYGSDDAVVSATGLELGNGPRGTIASVSKTLRAMLTRSSAIASARRRGRLPNRGCGRLPPWRRLNQRNPYVGSA